MFEDEETFDPRAKANVRKRLTQKTSVAALEFSERARLLTLHVILQRLRKADESAVKDLLKHLSEDEVQEFKEQSKPLKDFRFDPKEKPLAVSEYEQFVKKADLLYGRAERYSSAGKHMQAQKLYRKAEDAYERAIERLEELHEIDPSIEPFFDRSLVFGIGSNLGIDCVSVPRYVGSKSHHNQVLSYTKTAVASKVDCAIAYLERYLEKYDWS